jgi:ornithine cyclodeaminase/alanine dehydrogenase-like protein (mu-crystallin family)
MWFLSFLIGSIGRWLLIGAASAAILVGAYVWGRMDCKAAAEVRQYQEIVVWLNREIERRAARTKADNTAREADRARRAELDAEIRNLTNDLENADRECLSSDSIDRLREFWRR